MFYISCWSIFSQICIKIRLKDVFKKILRYFNTQEYYVTLGGHLLKMQTRIHYFSWQTRNVNIQEIKHIFPSMNWYRYSIFRKINVVKADRYDLSIKTFQKVIKIDKISFFFHLRLTTSNIICAQQWIHIGEFSCVSNK